MLAHIGCPLATQPAESPISARTISTFDLFTERDSRTMD